MLKIDHKKQQFFWSMETTLIKQFMAYAETIHTIPIYK